ncbi:MAG TPA: hypothetical protein VK550_22905 [Polyangiaceae bacterium]|nr:hypothetical protein [Polyangiaceae bacterium]
MKVRRVFFSLCLGIGALYGAAMGCGTSGTDTPDPGDGGAPPRDPVLDGGGDVAAPPNGASLCPPGVCNYQTGTGCAADGGAVSCVPLPMGSVVTPACERAGRTANGETCSQWTDCVSGSICAAGRCRKLCCGRDWTGCGTGTEHCLRQLQVQLADNSVVQSGAYLCYPVNQCDALVPSSCMTIEANTTCQIADPTGATACLPEGSGGVASPCPSRVAGRSDILGDEDCKGGFTCVEGGCRRLCRAVPGGGEPSCPAVEGACVHFNRDPPGVGECTPI